MGELDDILSQQSSLQSAGQGHFTVDPKRQRQLLARVGLQNIAQGFLKLCQGIYRTRPLNLHFHSQANLLRIQFRPQVDLPTPLWDCGPMRLAVLTLSQEYRLEWSWKNRGVASPEGFEETEESDWRSGLAEIVVSRPQVSWWHRDWTPSVRRLLERKLVWMFFPWTWNERNAPGPPALSQRAEAMVPADPGEPGDLPLPATSQAKIALVRHGIPESVPDLLADRRRGLAVLGVTHNSWSETFFVLDGVLLEGERNLLDRPGIVAVISAEGLTASLSGLELVHDAAFRERLLSLRPEVAWLDEINQKGR